jgi:broad specificity phosphatase PhoE
MKNIIVIQHTQSVHHTNGMSGGWTDWDLTEHGRKQAYNISDALKNELSEKDYVIYSSDLKRAVQTAQPLLKYIRSEPIYRTGLREINNGKATGKSIEWFNQNKAENTYRTCYSDYKTFDGSESYRDLWKRLETFMDEIIDNGYENIIIVSHGITLHLFFAMWIGLDFDRLNDFGIWAMAGGVSKLILKDDGRREIQYLNNLSYQAMP